MFEANLEPKCVEANLDHKCLNEKVGALKCTLPSLEYVGDSSDAKGKGNPSSMEQNY